MIVFGFFGLSIIRFMKKEMATSMNAEMRTHTQGAIKKIMFINILFVVELLSGFIEVFVWDLMVFAV